MNTGKAMFVSVCKNKYSGTCKSICLDESSPLTALAVLMAELENRDGGMLIISQKPLEGLMGFWPQNVSTGAPKITKIDCWWK